MRVLITGANGMVARAAVEHCGCIGDDVIALTRSELDIADPEAVIEAFEKYLPELVLNCAAYTDVDGAEANADECYKANADGVENLALGAKAAGAGFVTISTDYVFDGTYAGFYTQRDTPNPQGTYAKSKLEGEIRARYAYARSIIVRSGWIFGHGGTNFLSVVHRLLADGRSIKAIDDSFGTPTFADDLARRIRELGELDLPAIYHVVNAGAGTSYLGFAEKVCEIGGIDKALVESVSNRDLDRPAPRPVSSKLACLFSERFGLSSMPDWEESLRRFIEGEK